MEVDISPDKITHDMSIEQDVTFKHSATLHEVERIKAIIRTIQETRKTIKKRTRWI
jgi:hypothetical protein